MIAGVTAAINGTPPFLDERNNFYREAGTGQNLLTYFLAKNIFDIWNIFRSAFLFVMMFFIMADPPGNF